ncbi:Hydrocephalus-inducing protein, partial [Globisporangium splendens]
MTMSVHPANGTLAVNAMNKVEVTFSSNVLGDLLIPIRFRLHGSEEQLSVRFKANVIPPVFHFDADVVDFGSVSYSFPQTKTVKLISASKTVMKYSLRIPEEANYKKKEFGIVPANGKLDAYGKQEVRIHFTSLNVKAYDYRLVISVTGVGSDLLSVPIKAHCCVPEIVIQQPELDFGTCFLRYPHKQPLLLENKSPHLYGRFGIGEQDGQLRAIATYNASEFSGSIGPNEKVMVEIYLSCEKLGSIRLPMAVTVPGSTELPLSATLTALATGPKVELDQPEIHWGNCTCLADHERVLRMTNMSLIPAPYKTFIRNARSKFQIGRKEGVLSPGESVEFLLVANLDDTILLKDQLHILISEGENRIVPLAMKGIGTTTWPPSELRVIDFSHQMTNIECEWSCTLEDKGKRSQVLTWINRTAVAKLKQLETASAAASKKSLPGQKPANSKSSKSGTNNSRDGNGGGATQEDVIPVFSVFPASIELKPRTACVFVFKGLSLTAGLIQEELVCETRVGKEKTNKVAFVTEICGNFITPKLTPSASLLSFEYVHRPGIEISKRSKPLTLTNACELPLSFTLRAQTPFSLDCWEAILQPGEQIDVNVEFYPGFKDDHLYRVINGKAIIAYTGHPQKDSVDLIGDISFPNLSFESLKIDFGCTLNDTQKLIMVNVTNVSKVDTTFRWVFIEDEKEARALATAKKPYIPINQVFDILPIRGHLKPNESEKIEFIYYGHANRKFKSLVACEVEGGPEYELTLLGEASPLVYKLDKQFLDFGQVLYNKTEGCEFSILNIGKVLYGFSITAETIGRGRFVEVTPSADKVAPNGKQKIVVRLRPGIPEQFEETLVLEVAHFQPIEFKLFGVGIFASVNINLPRENHPSSTIRGENPKWRDLKKLARRNLELSTLNAAVVAANTVNTSTSLASSDSKSTISTVPRTFEKNNLSSSVSSMPPSPVGKAAQQRANGSHSPSRSHGASGPQIDELDIEIEACRLFFADYLLFQEARKTESKAAHKVEQLADTLPTNDSSEDIREATATTTAKALRPETGEKPLTKKRGPPESFPFVLSQFVLDFGNVVLGTHKIKKFSITNIGHVPVSFQLDKSFALSRGFQIEPEHVVRLPEKQAVEFTVTFQARKNITLGVHQAQLPITMKNGPPCILTIRALVTVPDISISMEMLDFGKLAVSTCHTMFTQLQNVSAVPAEWTVKKPMGSVKDLNYFRVTPQSGVLAPGYKVNVQIDFVPDDNRHFAIKLPIKVTSNPKTRSITCRVEGSELRVSFHPPMVELGPMLPCSGIAEHAVEMRNDTDYPVEVFSLDFDQVYKEDEELLRHLPALNADGILHLPVRALSQPLSDYLADNGLLSAECVETTDPPASVSPDSTGREPSAPVESGEEAREDATADHAELQSSSVESLPGLSAEPSKPQAVQQKGVDYIIVGPPRCGKSTQVHLLAEKEHLCVWSIDDAVLNICAESNSLGEATPRALGFIPASEQQEETTAVMDGVVGQSSPVPKDPVPQTSSSSVSESSPESKDDGQQQETTGGSSSVSSPSEPLNPLLTQVLEWRLSQPDLQHGGVLDGFEDAFVSMETAIAACSQVLSAARIIALSFDKECYEVLTTSLKDDDSKRGSKSVTPVASKELLCNQLHGGLAAEMVQEGEQALGGNEEATASSGEAETNPEIHPENASGTACAYPTAISDYNHLAEANRQYLVGFLTRERSTQLLTNASDASIPLAGDNTNGASSTKDWTRPDNFLLDIHINEPGPALSTHNLVYSAIKKHVRELESSHLVIPAPAKYQVIRRPSERFQIYAPPVAEESRHGSNQHEKDEPNERGVEKGSVEDLMTLPSSDSTDRPPVPATRWIIPARSKVDLLVQFSSSDVGIFDCNLGFEIAGVCREFTLFCRGVCTVPTINSDPRNVFMSRIKSHPEHVFMQEKFVLSKNQFEFGPLIALPVAARKVPETESECAQLLKTSANSVEVFRMSNSSLFPLRVGFTLEKTDSDPAFAMYPSFLDIPEGETGEVKLRASPTRDGLQENTTVCCVSDNPEPILFSVSCFGCTPALQLRGPWEQPAANSTSESDASPRDSSSAKPILDFEQLLLKRQEEKTFFIENVSPLAVSWSLLCGDLPPDFRVFPMEGTIKSLQKASVLVVFTANTKAVYKLSIQIQFSDAESALKISDRNRVVPLVIAAEVYKIEVSSFEKESAATAGIGNTSSGSATTANGDGSLDFGLVRVGESHSRSFTIRNRGKYNIKYVLSIRTHASRELFKVEPSELILEPDKVSSVNVAFFSKREVTLRDCKDIKCTIIEMISGEPCREFTVSTTVRSVFSVFRIQPNRGINFGPHKYNDLAKSKRMEVRNDGEFPFKFRIRPPTKSAAASGSPDDDSLSLGTLLNLAVLNIGQFSVSPDCGSVDPGVTVGVDVTFQPIDCKVYREFIHIEISGRNMLGPVGADSLQYELAGESCFPGITTNDFESIFEGQIVVRSLGLDCATAPAQQQRQPSSSSSNALGFSMLGIQSVVFPEKEQIFSFGTLIAAANSKGTVERFEITNPTKVTTTVQFQVSNSSHGSGFVSEVAPVQAFTVQPSVWEIPPLEHRFVSVYFKPTTIASYQAVFTAKVDESPPQVTAQSLTNDALLQFELRGEGMMPCVSILEPTQRDASGMLVLNFGRVRVSKSKDLSIILRNDGILSSTVLFSLASNPNFFFALGNGSVSIAPKATETLSIQFKPQKMHDEATTSLLKIAVHNNPFDEATVELTGTGYKGDLVFEDLPLGHDNELHFDDIQLLSEHHHNSQQDGNAAARATDAKVFSLYNQTSDTSSSSSGWDENARTVTFEGSQLGVSGADETLAEPAFETIGAPAVIALSCFAAADALSFDCDTTSITFKRTFMLQACNHCNSIHNKSKIKLVYSWRFERAFGADADGFLPNVSALSGSVDDDCPFEISPEAGTIAAETNQVFTVKFAPVEVDDYHYTLVLEAESAHDDDDASRTLRIDIRGTSLRPACHFDVERSDYAQRRAPHLVIEMESLGVRVRNTRRFYVVNPTNVSYEFTWTPEAEVNPCFRCATPKGLMLAGKRCEMIFEFTPQQLELQEMFWRFQVPHFQVNQLFLFVGTTTELRVILDRGSVNFNTLLIGTKASQSIALVNHEHIPFNFVFDKSSLDFANEVPALHVHPLSGVIPPNSHCNIDIEFEPTEEKTCNFNLNCIVKRKPMRLSLNVKGEGYSIHDALTIASDGQNETRSAILGVGNLADFGVVRVDEELQRCVVIHNRGKFNFEFNWNAQKSPVGFPIEPMQGTVKKTDKVTSKLLFAPSISVLSPREIVLRPKETADIEFKFAPTKRTPVFQKDVFLNIAGSKKKLVTLSGCCQGMEVALDTDTLSFGTVYLGSQLVRKVRLQNRGDVAAKFQWNPRAFTPDFTISPTEGMVAPNYHKTLEITFKPTAVNPDLRYDHLACILEGALPVFLTLVGGCIKQATSSIHDIYFESRVRESATKQIVVENTSTSLWNLFPVVTGDHWSCQENVTIPAEGKAAVDIVYCPLRMTKKRSSETKVDDSTRHHPEQLEGSIFFAIPDGTALLCNVFGKATAPASAGTTNVSTPAKKTLSIAVPMKNWLKTAQTLDVVANKPNGSESVRAQGPSSITVQGYATRNYNLKFFSYTEGVIALTLRFMNPENGEYVVYDVNVTVTQATEIEALQFEAPVRQSLKKTITIENPFDATRVVAFADPENWWRCSNPAIRVRQLTEITGRLEGLYEVEYRPTLHLNTPVEASLTISFTELGELVLATQPAGVERILHFKAPLGGSQTQSFAFTTFSDKPTDVVCSVQQPTFFSVPSALRIDGTMDWEGKNHVVQIKFEPEALGEIRDTLTLFADTVGEYKCTLHGVSVPPLPQGPIVFAESSTREIEFRNMFSMPKDFEVVVDNPRFTLSTKSLSIPAKSSKVTTVKVDPSALSSSASGVTTSAATAGKPAPTSSSQGAPPSLLTGKLFVSCPSQKELPSWVYYLEATASSAAIT